MRVFSGKGTDLSRLSRRAFEHSGRGRTHGHGTAAAGVEEIGRLDGKIGPFRMEDVILDPLGLDRPEGADPDVQGDLGYGNAPAGEAFEHIGREVESRRGSGHGAGDSGVERLVADPVAWGFASLADIRRGGTCP